MFTAYLLIDLDTSFSPPVARSASIGGERYPTQQLGRWFICEVFSQNSTFSMRHATDLILYAIETSSAFTWIKPLLGPRDARDLAGAVQRIKEGKEG